MSLPKISYPITVVKIPGTNDKYGFRPMLVREEKILLMAKESAEDTDILSAIKQVVSNCAADQNFEVDKIPLFVLEYIFLKLRGISMGTEVRVSYRDHDDQQIYDFKINLNDVIIKWPENIESKVAITDTAGITLKYPQAALYSDANFLKTVGQGDAFYDLAVKCIDKIYNGDEVFEGKDFKHEDLLEFINLMDMKSFEKVRNYLDNLPSLYYKITYKNALGNEGKIELQTLGDFFTLR